MVEGDVVWVRGDARAVESDEHVDCGGRRVGGLGGEGIRQVGCECRGEERCDLLFRPGRGHAILEVAAGQGVSELCVIAVRGKEGGGDLRILDNEHVVFIS